MELRATRILAFFLSAVVGPKSMAETSVKEFLVCRNQGFMALISPIGAWRKDAIVVLDLSVNKKDRHDGLGKLTQYDSSGSFTAEFPVDSNFEFPASGPTTEFRYSEATKEGLLLITPEGHHGAGDYAKTTCSRESSRPLK